MAQGNRQIEVTDFEETFAPVARLEAIWVTLTFVSCKDFKLFQMDVKSVFLNDFIEEECMVNNPPGLLILHIRILCTDLIKLYMV